MKKNFLLFAFIWSLPSFVCSGQHINLSKNQRVLFLLNASSSMNEPWAGNLSRFHAAERFILTLMDSLNIINKDVEFGLRVYGDQYPALENNCYDTHLEVRFSKDNRAQMGLRLEHIKPQGLSSVAFVLNESLKDIEDPKENDYQVILITDSPERCSKDFCPQAELLIKKTGTEPYVLDVSNNLSLGNVYACLGHYLSGMNTPGLALAIETILKPYRINKHPFTAGEGYIRLRNSDQVTITAISFQMGSIFIPISKMPVAIKNQIKIKAGSYRIIYNRGSFISKTKDLTVKDGMVTEVVLE